MAANGRTKAAKAAQADSRKRLQTYFKKVDTRKKNRLKARATGIKGGREGQEERIRNRAENKPKIGEKISRSSQGGRASASAARVAKLRAKEATSKKYTKVKKRPLTARLRESMKRVPLSLSYGARGGGGGAGRK